jgi:hypothetical protein
MPDTTRVTAAALVGVILALLAVGVASGTVVRHVIQVLPAGLALVLVIRRAAWAHYAALPIFAFWLLIMLAIWLFLLGLARITSGRFSPAEIALTLVIGASCLAGLSQVFRTQPAASLWARSAWAVAFGALQVAALWASLQPALADI